MNDKQGWKMKKGKTKNKKQKTAKNKKQKKFDKISGRWKNITVLNENSRHL